MKFPLPSLCQSRAGLFPRRAGGFALLELGLVLLAVALAGYITVTEVRKLQHRSHRDRFVADLRTMAAAFEQYRAQRGEWPAATNPEIRIPRGMESTLANTPWLAGPPFGGSYDWTLRPTPITGDTEAASKPELLGLIAVTAFSPGEPLRLTPADLLEIDRQIDDGDLSTGRFRTGFNGWPVYSVMLARAESSDPAPAPEKSSL